MYNDYFIKSEKVPANPIPSYMIERFKYRLAEISNENAERNLMIFFLGLATGYRLGDIVDLTIGEIRLALDRGMFVIQEDKQFKTWQTEVIKGQKKVKPPRKREAHIKSKLNKRLKEYIKGKKNSDYAFPSRKGDSYITQKSYSDILKAAGESLGLENITGHSLRKTFATKIYETTHDIEEVRIALGHKSIEVTKEYLGIKRVIRDNAANITDSLI